MYTPPYYAVIFTSILKTDDHAYHAMAETMLALARQQPGFIGVDSAREETGITVSYWQTLEDIKNWKQQTDHLQAQQSGKNKWYQSYQVRICKIEKEYSFTSD
ncbi:MAG: antibiotic biosynthesis monooxygenase [Gammaproteobacteria bacterium]|nr:antibiotic biosynthesis monooxygenase [Gammaproteobacteria bacterium]